MHSKNIYTYIITLFACFLSLQAAAQQFSYVYIQGDKETPFYVKMEDEMLPRYGKDYCIISQLAPGPITIQILFQQNAYPPERFTIKVPENSYRGFMLVRKGSIFSLYDLQQEFYLPAGNGIIDDHAPDSNPNNNYIATKPAATQPVVIAQPVVNTQPIQTDTTATATTTQPANTQPAQTDSVAATTQQVNTQPAQTNATATTTQQVNTAPAETTAAAPVPQDNAPVSASAGKQPQFIENIQLDNKRDIHPATNTTVTTPTPANSDYVATYGKGGPIVNSDCPQPMGDDEYNELYRKVLLKSDKSRLKYMISRLDNCLTTAQVRELTKTLGNDPERYAYLKQAYSRITDQSNFPALENLLTTQEWKSYFLLIMP